MIFEKMLLMDARRFRGPLKIRVRVFSLMFTFLVSLSFSAIDIHNILDLPNSLLFSHLTVSRNTLHVRRTSSFVGATKLNEMSVLNLVRLGEDVKNNLEGVKVPGFREIDLQQDPVPISFLPEGEAGLSQREEDEEKNSISISTTVEPEVLKRVESHFLKMFGMNKRPQRKGKQLKIPKYLLDMYQKQTGDEMPIPTSNLNLPGRNVRTANTVRTFYLEPGSSSSTSSSFEPLDPHHLKFNLNSLPEAEQVTGAELRVPFTVFRDFDFDTSVEVFPVKVLLHDVIKPKTPSNSRKRKELHLKEAITMPIDVKTVNMARRKNGTSTIWLTFDVFPAVSRWIEGKNRKINHGLLLEILGLEGDLDTVSPGKKHHVRVKRASSTSEAKVSSSSEDDSGNSRTTEVGAVKAVIPSENESSSSHPIVLFTYSDDGHDGRKTRDAKTLSRRYRAAQQNQQRRRKNHRNKNRKRNLCARHTMFVDFQDVGWNDWIVAPPGYHAFHCSGECPFPMADHLNATNHAVIQALVHSMNPGLVPSPCCVPTKYSSLSLLYTDSSDKIVLKNYNEMVVDSCGCS